MRLTFFTEVLHLCLVALAAPRPHTSRHSTHHTRIIGRGIQVEVYHPSSTYETYGQGINHPLTKRAATSSLEDLSISFVRSRMKVETALTYHSGYAGEVASHAYVRQVYNNVSFANAVANVAFKNNEKVVAFGSSFVDIQPGRIAPSTPSVDVSFAISTAENTLEGKYNNHPTDLRYLVNSDGSIALTHSIQIENEDTGTWYNAYVDAHSGELAGIVDFVMQATYLVLPFPLTMPAAASFEQITNPVDNVSSPLGWHNDGSKTYLATSGNNALAFKTIQTMLTNESAAGFDFIYPQDPTVSPTTPGNVDAARTNTFYLVNMMHDISYRYGFTEAAFNFQVDNFGKGGLGGDMVQINVQSNAGINNADFATPPDGQWGKMRQFLWYYSSPERDGSMENDIVIHENTHGITNRMTGGGSAMCLQTLEAVGLAEGWSDAMADWASKTSADVPDFVFGAYVMNDPLGMRTLPYSTNSTTNPYTYSHIATQNEPHYIGEVWANTLHNLYAALVEEYGFSTAAHTDPTGTEGNVVWLHLFIDALPIQPCNPSFLQARAAWIQADANRYSGRNACLLWKIFASKGMGVSAANYVDAFDVPGDCQ